MAWPPGRNGRKGKKWSQMRQNAFRCVVMLSPGPQGLVTETQVPWSPPPLQGTCRPREKPRPRAKPTRGYPRFTGPEAPAPCPGWQPTVLFPQKQYSESLTINNSLTVSYRECPRIPLWNVRIDETSDKAGNQSFTSKWRFYCWVGV